MRAIDADALQLAIVEEGQANKRKKYIIGDIWELSEKSLILSPPFSPSS